MEMLRYLLRGIRKRDTQQPTNAIDAPAMLAEPAHVERYQLLVRQASPIVIERAYTDGFAGLSSAQRTQALQELTAALPAVDQVELALASNNAPTLARIACRLEQRTPGIIERTLGDSSDDVLDGAMFAQFVASFANGETARRWFEPSESGYSVSDDGRSAVIGD
jgi:hypothetical protein